MFDISFFGTWNGDVLAVCIRDVPASASPLKNQRRKPSMKATAAVALLAASLGQKSPEQAPTSSSVFRIMVCQRTICAIAASNRSKFPANSSVYCIDRTLRTVVACAKGWGCWIGSVSESGLSTIGLWKVQEFAFALSMFNVRAGI